MDAKFNNFFFQIYTDAFSFFDAIVSGDGIFITAKLPGYIKVGRDDLIDQYLFLTTSHDGYGRIMAAFTPIRIVCNNTLNAALRNHTNSIKIRHTANAKDRLETAHTVLGLSDQLAAQLGEVFNHWTTVRINDREIRKLIELAMVPNKEVLSAIKNNHHDQLSSTFKNICDTALEYAMTSPSQQTETTKCTLFGAYNAITGYYQNVRSYNNGEAKLKSMLFGGTAQIRTQKAFS